MRRTKVTKVLTMLLCQCMILGTISMNVQAATVGDNSEGSTVENISRDDTMEHNDGTVKTNYGTIKYNNGTIEINNGTVKTNDGTVTINYGTVENTLGPSKVINNYGAISLNYGKVENNYGTVAGNFEGGRITNDYREVTIIGTNADKITTEGVNAAPDTAPDNFKQKKFVLIKSNEVSSGTIKLTPIAGYHFASKPTVSTECTEDTNGSYYEYTEISEAITITVDVVADTPSESIPSGGQTSVKTLASTNYAGAVLSSWEAVNKALADLVIPALIPGESQAGTAPLLKVNIASTDKVIAKTTQDVIKEENKGLHVHLGDGFAITMVGTNMIKDNVDINADFTMADTVKDGNKERAIDFTNKGALTLDVTLHAYLPNATAGDKATIYVENADGTRTQVAVVTISDLNRICWSINSLQKYVIVY